MTLIGTKHLKHAIPQEHILTRPIADPFSGQRKRPKASMKHAVFGGHTFPVSPVLDTFFWFVAERHRMFRLRLAGEPGPWTKDPILAAHTFTNVFRIYDSNTQYILRHVINKGSQDLYESCFRVLLFRTFNKVETWELIESQFGTPTWKHFDVETYEVVLLEATDTLYGAGYIIPAPNFGWEKNVSNHLRLIELMMTEDFPGQLKKLRHLRDAHGQICLYPSMGNFTALQLLLDLNMLPHFNFGESEWAALGPGSLACIRKMFGPSVRGHEDEALKYLHESQHSHFARLSISRNQIPRLCKARPAGLSMVDIEHALCECEKYSRARFPNIKGKRTSVGRRWSPGRSSRITADLPEKWLQPVSKNSSLTYPPPVEGSADATYEVSHIVAEKQSGQERYLVRWVGYGPEDDTWFSEEGLQDGAGELLKEWNATKDRIAQRVQELRASK